MSPHNPLLHLCYAVSEAWHQLQSPSPSADSLALSPVHMAALSQEERPFQSGTLASEEQECDHKQTNDAVQVLGNVIISWCHIVLYRISESECARAGMAMLHPTVRDHMSGCLTGGAGSCKQWKIWQESVTNRLVWQGNLSRISAGLGALCVSD